MRRIRRKSWIQIQNTPSFNLFLVCKIFTKYHPQLLLCNPVPREMAKSAKQSKYILCLTKLKFHFKKLETETFNISGSIALSFLVLMLRNIWSTSSSLEPMYPAMGSSSFERSRSESQSLQLSSDSFSHCLACFNVCVHYNITVTYLKHSVRRKTVKIRVWLNHLT